MRIKGQAEGNLIYHLIRLRPSPVGWQEREPKITEQKPMFWPNQHSRLPSQRQHIQSEKNCLCPAMKECKLDSAEYSVSMINYHRAKLEWMNVIRLEEDHWRVLRSFGILQKQLQIPWLEWWMHLRVQLVCLLQKAHEASQ